MNTEAGVSRKNSISKTSYSKYARAIAFSFVFVLMLVVIAGYKPSSSVANNSAFLCDKKACESTLNPRSGRCVNSVYVTCYVNNTIVDASSIHNEGGVTMAHLAGYSNRSTVKKMLAHYERSFKCDKDNIDFDRTPLNKNLAPNRPEGQEAYLDELLSEVSTIKSNTNILSDWIITLPQNEELEEREDEFFQYAYQRIVEMLPEGERCILSAYIHYDESQAHLHIAFCGLTTSKVTKNTNIPQRWAEKDEVKNPEHKAGDIKRDKKGNIRYLREDVIDNEGNPVTKTTLSQSGIFNRSKMASFHSDLESALCKDLRLKHVGILLDEDAVIQKALSCVPHEHLDSVKKHFEQREAQIKNIEKNQESNLRALEIREKQQDEREFDLNIREKSFYQNQAKVLRSVETAHEEVSKSKNTLTAEEWGYSFKKKLPSLIPNEKIRNTLATCIDRYISFVNRDVVKAITVAKELLSRRGKSREDLSSDVFATATDIEQKQIERERQGKGGLSR